MFFFWMKTERKVINLGSGIFVDLKSILGVFGEISTLFTIFGLLTVKLKYLNSFKELNLDCTLQNIFLMTHRFTITLPWSLLDDDFKKFCHKLRVQT